MSHHPVVCHSSWDVFLFLFVYLLAFNCVVVLGTEARACVCMCQASALLRSHAASPGVCLFGKLNERRVQTDCSSGRERSKICSPVKGGTEYVLL